MKVIFRFTTGHVGCKREETVEFDDDTADEEIDEALSQWLWENSGAAWWKEE